MKRFIGASLVLLMLLAVTLITPQIISAQEDYSFYWEFINVVIDVQENGDMLVMETQKYVFTAPHTNERYRWIPLDKIDTIDSVEVSEDGEILSATTGIKNNQLWIKWSHPLNPPEKHTFVLKYRVIGALRIHDEGDQVYWKAIFKDRDAPIQSSKVTVRLPESLAGRILSFDRFGASAGARQVDSQTVEFVSRTPLPPGKELEVQVTFLHGVLYVPVPAWQQNPTPGGFELIFTRFVAPVIIGLGVIVLYVLVARKWGWGSGRGRGGGGGGGGG